MIIRHFPGPFGTRNIRLTHLLHCPGSHAPCARSRGSSFCMNASCSGVAAPSEVPMSNGGGGPAAHGIFTPCWIHSSTLGGAPIARHFAARSLILCRRKSLPGPPEEALLVVAAAARLVGALLAAR